MTVALSLPVAKTAHHYSGYGITIGSEIELEFLPTATPVETPCLNIRYCKAAALPANLQQINLGIRANSDCMTLLVPTIATYIINSQSIEIESVNKTDQEGIQTFLYSAALGYWLVRSGKAILYGSVITEDQESSTIYLGRSKEILPKLKAGAKLISAGFVVISEKQGTIIAEPGFPVIKIWQKESQELNLNPSSLKKVRSVIKRYYWDLTKQHCSEKLPIKCIKIVNSSPLKADPTHKKITGIQKLKHLVPFQPNFQLNSIWKNQSHAMLWMRLVQQTEWIMSFEKL